MREFIAGNWMTMLIVLPVLVCPLGHALGHAARHWRSPSSTERCE